LKLSFKKLEFEQLKRVLDGVLKFYSVCCACIQGHICL